MCAAASAGDPFRDWLARSTSGVPGIGAAAAGADAFGDAAAALVCPSPDGGASGGAGAGATYPPVDDNPLGQCPTRYNLGLIATFVPFGETELVTRELRDTATQFYDGPLGEPVVRLANSSSYRIGWSNLPTNASVEIFYQPGTFEQIEYSPLPEREDNQPDNCGGSTEQESPTGGDDITYEGPDGTDVTNPITFNPTIPIVLPGGQLVVPVEACILAICFNLDFNISTGDISFNFGGEPGASNCCPPIEDGERQDDDGDPSPPDSDVRFWGLKVSCTTGGLKYETTEYSDGNGPSFFWPDLGFVRFAFEVGGVRGWSEKIAIQTQNMVIQSPGDAVAYGYDIYERPGVTISVKEIVVKPQAEN